MQGHRSSILTACAVLIGVVIVGLAITSLTVTDSKARTAGQNQKVINGCDSCHEMKPEVLTWQISAHSPFPCTTCHEIDISRYKIQYDSQRFQKPIRIKESIPNTVCLKCHTLNRETSPSGDLIIPHDRHNSAGVTCVKCHSGVVHARIADRGLTMDEKPTSYLEWDLSAAKKAATKTYLQPNMWTCINCHKQAGITTSCKACHTKITSLPSHENQSWISEHGRLARSNIGECTKCHATPGQPHFISPATGDVAADFARAQVFCSNCHRMRPKMHELSMASIHPGKVMNKGLLNCLTCHNAEQPQADQKVTRTYCNQCHWMQKGHQ